MLTLSITMWTISPCTLFWEEPIDMPDTALAPAAARPYHHGDLRRGLLDAASELMAEDQNWTFSLREVARRAGASHNAPYNHFASKNDLLVAIAAEGFKLLRER